MSNQAEAFILSQTEKPLMYTNCLKWIIRHTTLLDFRHAFNIFNRLENQFSKPEHGVNFFSNDFLPIQHGLFGGYMLEKVIVYSNGESLINVNTVRNNFPSGDINLGDFYNRFNNVQKTLKSSAVSTLSTIMIPIMSEQLRLQKPLYPDLIRFFKCFGEDETISAYFEDTFHINFRKMYLLGFALFAYIVIQHRNGRSIIQFKTTEFINYIQAIPDVSSDDIEIFLNSIALTREQYIDKYHSARLDLKGNPYDYAYQEYFDRALPRISYSYPLLKVNESYLLISFASYIQFLKMDRFYRMLTFDISKDFKSTHIGPAIERYVASLASKYAETIPSESPCIHGNKGYKHKGKKDEPDVILETDKHILFIECKANAFGMHLIKEFDTKSFEKIVSSVKISIANINRYLTVHSERLNGKTVHKMLVFYEGIDQWFDVLSNDVNAVIPENDMILTGMATLENLFLQKHKSIWDLLKQFKEHKLKHPHAITLEMFLDPINENLPPDEAIFLDLAKEFGMLTPDI
ncbi:MAG: hypothetical protein PHV10_06815 [Sulfuricurvum sp.]|nr:hypothetical protein [Sulfuricurvum sp.]